MEQVIQSQLANYGMDLSETVARFGGNETVMLHFLKNFPEDQTIITLREAMASGSRDTLKMAVHSLKGLSGNLGLTPLFEAASVMMNTLRANESADVQMQYKALENAYQATLDMLATLH